MVAVKKWEESAPETAPAEMTKVEASFFAAIENPKPAPAYLREMFRLHGRKPQED